MESQHSPSTYAAHSTFGDLLRHLRRQAYMTQRDLALATGYSIGQICRFEGNQCVPDLPTLTARFVPALIQASDTATAERLLALADTARATHREGQRRQLPLLLVSEEPGVGRDSALALPPLPIPATPLLGREREVAEVCALLQQATVRLLSLTGAPGIGKTRLGLQAAADLYDAFADRVVFVALAPVSDPNLVAATLVQALGIQEQAGQTVMDCLKDFLRKKQLLLLLDNFEHVLAAAPLVGELLATAPRLKVLATSRRPLHLSGEQEFMVAPLALPPRGKDAQASACTATLTQYAAVQLFIARARAVKADLALTDATAAAIAEICHRLDGMPLAIELAAARIKLFAPEALLRRLERRLPLLTGGPRDLPARQRTLRTTIDWSYQLLDAGERRLFARLGVFVGGCTLEAVEAVCTAEGEQGWDVLDGLAALVDQSLVRQEEGLDSEPRFVMLETIREYASEQLVARSELVATRHQHAGYYLTFAQAAESGVSGPLRKHWIDQLEQEHANLRAVLEWASAHGETQLGLQLSSVLWQLWDAQGTLTEGRAQLSALLAQAQSSSPTLARIKALYGAGVMAWNQGNLDAAHALWEERLKLAGELGDQLAIADALRDVGWTTYRHGGAATGRRMIEESLAIHRNLGNQSGVWRALDSLAHSLAQISSEQGDYATVRSLAEQSLAIVQELGDSSGIAFVRLTLGEIARLQGDYRLARFHYEQGLAMGRALNDNYRIAETCSNLGYITLNEGGTDRATALFQESLTLSRRAERQPGMILCLVGLAGVASVRQQHGRAAHLLGAATALLDATHLTLDTTDRRDYDRIVAKVRDELDEASFATAWAEGRTMPIAQAIAYALEPLPEMRPRSAVIASVRIS